MREALPSIDTGARLSFLHLLPVCLWASSGVSLCLGVLIWKMELVVERPPRSVEGVRSVHVE